MPSYQENHKKKTAKKHSWKEREANFRTRLRYDRDVEMIRLKFKTTMINRLRAVMDRVG